MERLTTNRGFWVTLLLTIVTLGIYQWYLIYAFARETNMACSEDGKSTSGLLVFILFTILTLGIYAIVWQAMLINRRCNYLSRHVDKRQPSKCIPQQINTFGYYQRCTHCVSTLRNNELWRYGCTNRCCRRVVFLHSSR